MPRSMMFSLVITLLTVTVFPLRSFDTPFSFVVAAAKQTRSVSFDGIRNEPGTNSPLHVILERVNSEYLVQPISPKSYISTTKKELLSDSPHQTAEPSGKVPKGELRKPSAKEKSEQETRDRAREDATFYRKFYASLIREHSKVNQTDGRRTMTMPIEARRGDVLGIQVLFSPPGGNWRGGYVFFNASWGHVGYIVPQHCDVFDVDVFFGRKQLEKKPDTHYFNEQQGPYSSPIFVPGKPGVGGQFYCQIRSPLRKRSFFVVRITVALLANVIPVPSHFALDVTVQAPPNAFAEPDYWAAGEAGAHHDQTKAVSHETGVSHQTEFRGSLVVPLFRQIKQPVLTSVSPVLSNITFGETITIHGADLNYLPSKLMLGPFVLDVQFQPLTEKQIGEALAAAKARGVPPPSLFLPASDAERESFAFKKKMKLRLLSRIENVSSSVVHVTIHEKPSPPHIHCVRRTFAQVQDAMVASQGSFDNSLIAGALFDSSRHRTLAEHFCRQNPTGWVPSKYTFDRLGTAKGLTGLVSAPNYIEFHRAMWWTMDNNPKKEHMASIEKGIIHLVTNPEDKYLKLRPLKDLEYSCNLNNLTMPPKSAVPKPSNSIGTCQEGVLYTGTMHRVLLTLYEYGPTLQQPINPQVEPFTPSIQLFNFQMLAVTPMTEIMHQHLYVLEMYIPPELGANHFLNNPTALRVPLLKLTAAPEELLGHRWQHKFAVYVKQPSANVVFSSHPKEYRFNITVSANASWAQLLSVEMNATATVRPIATDQRQAAIAWRINKEHIRTIGTIIEKNIVATECSSPQPAHQYKSREYYAPQKPKEQSGDFQFSTETLLQCRIVPVDAPRRNSIRRLSPAVHSYTFYGELVPAPDWSGPVQLDIVVSGANFQPVTLKTELFPATGAQQRSAGQSAGVKNSQDEENANTVANSIASATTFSTVIDKKVPQDPEFVDLDALQLSDMDDANDDGVSSRFNINQLNDDDDRTFHEKVLQLERVEGETSFLEHSELPMSSTERRSFDPEQFSAQAPPFAAEESILYVSDDDELLNEPESDEIERQQAAPSRKEFSTRPPVSRRASVAFTTRWLLAIFPPDLVYFAWMLILVSLSVVEKEEDHLKPRYKSKHGSSSSSSSDSDTNHRERKKRKQCMVVAYRPNISPLRLFLSQHAWLSTVGPCHKQCLPCHASLLYVSVRVMATVISCAITLLAPFSLTCHPLIIAIPAVVLAAVVKYVVNMAFHSLDVDLSVERWHGHRLSLVTVILCHIIGLACAIQWDVGDLHRFNRLQWTALLIDGLALQSVYAASLMAVEVGLAGGTEAAADIADAKDKKMEENQHKQINDHAGNSVIAHRVVHPKVVPAKKK